MEKKIKDFSSSLYMRRKARKTTAMTHSTISHVTNVKKAMIFFCFLFLISQADIPLAKRKGVALVFAILEINFGVLRPEAAKAANHARRRDRTAPNESFFWN